MANVEEVDFRAAEFVKLGGWLWWIADSNMEEAADNLVSLVTTYIKELSA